MKLLLVEPTVADALMDAVFFRHGSTAQEKIVRKIVLPELLADHIQVF
jgi:hypothetical protein